MTKAQLDVRPFEAIPRDLARRMRPHSGLAADPVPEAVPVAVDPATRKVQERIVRCLEHFYALVEDPHAAWERIAPTYVELGREMARDGQDLDEMHMLMCRTARSAWHSITAIADSLDIERSTLGMIADAQFSYMDAVAALVTQGYETESAGTTEALHRRRTRLLALLLAEPPVPEDVIADAARSAEWRLPRTVAAVTLKPRRMTAHHPPALPPDVLADPPVLVLPDPEGPGRLRILEPLLRNWVVVVGPTVQPTQTVKSLRWAQEALELVGRGVIAGTEVVRCMDHVPTLAIFRAEELIEHAAAARLAPLRALSPVQAERLSETLLSLLENKFNATEAGNQMHVHPQTVRYRLRRLEQLFGDDLFDPRRSLELEMILHARLGNVRTRDEVPAAASE
ncbi:helix-turn-helix domain-containing protein [Actinomadura barringtoniae]|uniref:Helix-turn-helix domain-containing protein n=1 Tax=Actinomadura barringtoniae TaxID=1427535 RepID=A0A939PTC6_9ACTN|nr:helix-turn-helix domain-containing protein [Actinomadura barringtoniae]MBO2455879.1 helix-turn-helix domain-containing protein [Actinomadura barringtoniae]